MVDVTLKLQMDLLLWLDVHRTGLQVGFFKYNWQVE